MNTNEIIERLQAAHDVIESLYKARQEDAMYNAMGCTGFSVQDSLSALIEAVAAGEVKA